MENASTARTHPLVLAAAASVLVVSAAGTAALMGWMPATRGAPQAADPVAAVTAAPAVPPVVAAAPEVKPAPDSKPAPQPKRAARKTVAPKPIEAPKTIEEPVRAAYEPPALPRVAESAPPPVAAAPAVCHDCGVVASVRAIEQPGEGSGVGAVAGGVAGGAVGSQFGKGKGQIVGTVIGAVGGAIAGHQVERHVVRKQTQYEITVRLDDGTTRTIVQATEPAWRPGDQVRVIGNEIRSAS
jgi:outer membrane lipoprotein SlyB